MTIEEMKKWIDESSYGQLLSKWKYSPIGDDFFRGEVGEYYRIKMREKKELLDNNLRVLISKSVDWNENNKG